MWNRSKNGNTEDYGKWFGQAIAGDNAVLGGDKDETWAKFDLTSTINRDRNAPSVIMWSLGNEMMEGISGSVSGFRLPPPSWSHGRRPRTAPAR